MSEEKTNGELQNVGNSQAKNQTNWASRLIGAIKNVFSKGELKVVQNAHTLTNEEVEDVFNSKEFEDEAKKLEAEFTQPAPSAKEQNSITEQAQSEPQPEADMSITKEEVQKMLTEQAANLQAQTEAREKEMMAKIEVLQSQNEELNKQRGLDKEELMRKANEAKPFQAKQADKNNTHLDPNDERLLKGVVKVDGVNLNLDAIAAFSRENADVLAEAKTEYQKRVLPQTQTTTRRVRT